MIQLQPDLVWLDDRFHRHVAVLVDPDTGRIAGVGRTADPTTGDTTTRASEPPGGVERVPLPGRALLPGFVNAHSHAFQRLGRGRAQSRPADGDAADFWSWREAMYGIALSLSAEQVYDVSRFCFLEMLRTGITAVGEFHYLHHQPDGRPYPEPSELAHRVMVAAEDVGLRIVLLDVCYATGGIGRELMTRQRRFRAASLDGFLYRAGRLHDRVRDRVRAAGGTGNAPGGGSGGLASMGIAPHSIRAVPRDWLAPLREWAVERDVALHMHVSERPAEVAASLEVYGLRPVELLAEDGLLDDRMTAIHATHLTDGEVRLLGDAGATVCACPTTERDLGDGFLPGLDLVEAGAAIALGTDSHTNLDFLEEMRLVEYHERLRRLERVVMAHPGPGDDRLRVAPGLLRMATADGARSLRIDAGGITAGGLADLISVDLDHHSLAGWSDETLPAMITLSATPDIVRDAWVGGVRRVEDRRHASGAEVAARFRAVADATGSVGRSG